MSATVTNCLDDASAANHLVPASDTHLAIVCDDAGTCVNTVDATLDTPDGVRACIVVSGQGHTIKADSAVAVRRSDIAGFITKCAPIKDVKELPHVLLPSPFTSDTVYTSWEMETGTSSTFSACMSTSASTVICTDATDIKGDVGEVQFCGGTCVMVYLGSQEDGSCSPNQERRFYQSVCKDGNIADYSIFQLAFTDFEVRYVAVINGTAWNLWEEQPTGTVLSLSADFENPFTNYQMALQGSNFTGAHVSPDAMDRTNCYGYCGLALQEGDSLAMTMYGNCVTPNSDCRTATSPTCTATVQFFDQSKAGSSLPLTVSGATLEYNGTNYIVQFSASTIPLKGRVEFSVPNTERVLPSEAATNVNGIVTTLLPQDADHEDVVVVYTDGAVATASRDCAFTLLETRDKNRMYSMRNVRNVTECDLLLSNGASERSLSVAAQTTKNAGATVVANATALWPVNPPDTESPPPGSESPPPGSEPRSSGLSKGAKIGIGVGVPVGVIVIACAIVLIVYRCRRKKEVRTLPSEEVAEPPKEGNPLVHPVANATQDDLDSSTSSDSLGFLDRVGSSVMERYRAKRCAEWIKGRRGKWGIKEHRMQVRFYRHWRARNPRTIPPSVHSQARYYLGEPEPPQPPCRCAEDPPSGGVDVCLSDHNGEWVSFNLYNYYDPNGVCYHYVWFPAKACVFAVRLLFASCYSRMAADAELRAGHGEKAALKAALKAEADDEDFLDAELFGLYYGDKRIGEESVTLGKIAQQRGRKWFFSLRKRQVN